MLSVWRVARWVILALALGYIAIVIYAYPHDHQEHLDVAAVAKIDSQKITMADVDGSNLPPPPDPSQAEATIAGVDANDNGIRDDVELAIFAEYPTSSATSTNIRSAELQYAMALQVQITEVFDPATWEAAAHQYDHGFGCLYDVSSSQYSSFENEVYALVLNTPSRTKQFNSIEQYGVSYKLSSGPDCDVSRN
jgi:hypothetical protein